MLIISTLTHFCSILPLIKYYKNSTGYINIIILSTIMSILYHYDETNYTIKVIDYLFATIWLGYDIYMGYTHTNNTLIKILLVNMASFLINIQLPYTYHSLWHCINAYKCYYVSNMLAKILDDPSILKSHRPLRKLQQVGIMCDHNNCFADHNRFE